MIADYLRVGRLYFILLAIFTVARLIQGATGVPYERAHQVFSIVTLTFMASAFFAAFCRRWRGYTIAQAMGIPHDSPQRVQAGIQYTLSEAADSGHCFLPEPNLIADAAQILAVPPDLVRSCLDEVAGDHHELAADHEGSHSVTASGGGTLAVPETYMEPRMQ